MDGFLGIDIGTTNSKALLLSEDGQLQSCWTQKTPEKTVNGKRFIDIQKIEEFMDYCTLESGKICNLRSIGFSSIGESVVPIKDGKALYMPLVWYEEQNVSEVDTGTYTDFEYTGVHNSGTFSLYKIFWMEKNILTEKPDFWLPVSSYLVYRKTGVGIWDTSQAGRSYMYNIHNKSWITDITEKYAIRVPEKIGRIGQFCAEKDGIVYGLGGHDHYVGLFAVHHLCDRQELFYDSMGSSSVLAAIMKDDNDNLKGKETYNPNGGCLVTGFLDGEYVVNRSLDYYGRLLDRIRNWKTETSAAEFFDSQNIQMNSVQKDSLCLFACRKGYGKYSKTADYMNCLEIKDRTGLNELVFSAYVYLSLGSRAMYKELCRFCSSSVEDMPYFAGGGITQNSFFMKLKATALDREIKVLKTTELSALGAVIAGMCACRRDGVLREEGKKLLYKDEILPDSNYDKILNQMRERYEGC